MKKLVSIALVLVMLVCMVVPGMAETEPEATAAGPVLQYQALRTANNPGYYYSGVLINMGTNLSAGVVDKDTFSAKAQVKEANGNIQGGSVVDGAWQYSFGNFGWDPNMADRVEGLTDGWAKWNILDAYVCDANGNRASGWFARGNHVKLDIEWGCRTIQDGESSAQRFDVPATRAAWYTVPARNGYMSFATIALEITQNKAISGIAEGATFEQGETRHDPIFSKFTISDAPGGGTYALYKPENASADNKRPIIVWFHGTGERYNNINPGGNLVGNRALSFADKAFQDALGGCYVLAPQSTTAGWSGSRLADMEALIKQIVDENFVDSTRIIVGGLSMGTGMTTPLILSQTENAIDFAAAILCAGGSLNADQAAIVASKGFPMFLVGSTSDGAANGLPSTRDNLEAAGVDVELAYYPAGPVFDGKDFFGAHDAWNYIYNNLARNNLDENEDTIYAWINKQMRAQTLDVTTTSGLIKKGDFFDVAASFRRTTTTNAATIEFTYDKNKFEFVQNLAENSDEPILIDGVSYLKSEPGSGKVKLTLMIADKNAKDLVNLRFKAKENANLTNEENAITATVNYAVVNPLGEKIIMTSIGTTYLGSQGIPGDTNGDGIVTLIDLSNVIDLFGVRSSDALWAKAKFFDLNKNSVIDIQDIVAIAQLIK